MTRLSSVHLCYAMQCCVLLSTLHSMFRTRVLLGLRAREIHVCGGMEACEIVRTLMASTGDDFEVINYNRLSTLKCGKQISAMHSSCYCILSSHLFQTLSLFIVTLPSFALISLSLPSCLSLSHCLSICLYLSHFLITV